MLIQVFIFQNVMFIIFVNLVITAFIKSWFPQQKKKIIIRILAIYKSYHLGQYVIPGSRYNLERPSLHSGHTLNL